MTDPAARDGTPPPENLPRGECICTRLDGGDIRIDQADPRVLISGELLDNIARFGDSGQPVDCLTLNAWLDTAGCKPGHGYVGAVLKISGVGRQVIYRITDMVPRINGYIGEWPD